MDHGIPYNDGPLTVGELTLAETIQGIPKHAKGRVI